MKQALFTEPNDQSSWNYHKWLISVLTPVQLIDLKKENETISLTFSTVLKSGADLIVKANGN